MKSTLSSQCVSAEWLAANLDAPDLRTLDARLRESYAEGHIPNAVHVDLETLRAPRDGVEGQVLAPEPFRSAARSLGIDPQTRVVIYDDHFGLIAARVAWSLLYYGHSQVWLLDGGWDAWESAQRPVTTEPHTPEAGRFEPESVATYLADLAWVRAHLESPQVVLLDVRAESEYRQGHIPGAVAWNWENGIDPAQTFGPAETLRRDLAQIGVTPDKEIITYCQTGVRASHTFLLLRELGFPRVRMYDGSWAEWSLYGLTQKLV